MDTPKKKNPHAVALGRNGGRARREALEPARRSEIARDAVNARWVKERARKAALIIPKRKARRKAEV